MFTVVLLEEEPRVAHALARELRHLGVRVITLDDAESVSAVLEREAPQLLVADLWTSDRQGIPVLEMARESFPKVRRCLLTGSFSQLSREQLERIRPCVLLPKPWCVADLVKLIE